MSGSPDSDRMAALSACQNQAREQVVNPIASFYEWLAVHAEELNTDVEADQRVVEARRVSSDCILRLGYGVSTETELTNLFSARVDQILEPAQDQSTPVSSVIDQLLPLAAEEDSITEAVEACVVGREAIVEDVTNQYQRVFLDKNESLVAEQLEEFKQRVTALIATAETA